MPTTAEFEKGLAAFQKFREAHIAEESEIAVFSEIGEDIERLETAQAVSDAKCDQLHGATEEAGMEADEWIEYLLGRGPNPEAPAPVDPPSD